MKTNYRLQFPGFNFTWRSEKNFPGENNSPHGEALLKKEYRVLKKYSNLVLLITTFFMAVGYVDRVEGQICVGCGAITGLPALSYGCVGSNYNVEWGYDGGGNYIMTSYIWAPPIGVVPIDGAVVEATTITVPTVCTTYELTINALGPNEIPNGDFAAAALPGGFATDYGAGLISDYGNYCFALDPHDVHTYYCDFANHTPGGGFMMMVNGANLYPYERVLHSEMPLCCNQTYHFSIWFTSWFAEDPAHVTVTVNGIDHILLLSGVCGDWQEIAFDFNTGPCTGDPTVPQNITVIDVNTDQVGNDFAIDDISIRRRCTTMQPFTLCPFIGVAITGPTNVCVGNSIPLANPATGGTWTSSNTTIATVGTTGIVTGVTSGVATITYTLPGECYATASITVNPIPTFLSGTTNLCVGASSTFTYTPTGGTWLSSNTSIATVSSGGLVTGVANGTATITYTSTSGCFTTTLVTINTMPATISGSSSLCMGATTTYNDATTGGTWASSNTSVATIDAGGAITAVAPGVTTISYTLGICTQTAILTVNALPTVTANALPTAICLGGSTTLTTGGAGTYVWSPAAGLSCTTCTGPTATPSVTTTYTVTGTLVTGCSNTATVTVTVNDLPTITATNNSPVCAGTDILLTGTATSTANYTYNWAGPGGFTATTAGTAATTNTVSATTLSTWGGGYIYILTVTDGNGCTATATTTATVNALPTITFTPALPVICLNDNITITASGGTSYSWVADATLSCTTCAGPVATPTANTTYSVTVTDANGCQNTASITVTVNPLPTVTATTTTNPICTGNSSILNAGGDAISYTWSPATALSCTACGVTVATPTATTTYTVTGTSALGCQNTASITISVNPLPTVTATDNSPVCAGGDLLLTGTAAGTTDFTYSWAGPGGFTASTAASTAATNTVTATTSSLWSGSYVYTLTVTDGNGCVAMATTAASVNPLPDIAGENEICIGSTTSLIPVIPGGTWYTPDITVINIDASGNMTGLAAGTGIVTYTLSTGCIATWPVTVDAPTPITGTLSVCLGSTTTLYNTDPTGIWISGTTSVATIDPGYGYVNTSSVGTTIITYAGAFCAETAVLTVNPTPGLITGTLSVCEGGITTLSDGPLGGTWTSSNTSIATVSSTGVVNGVSGGTATITYTIGATAMSSCYVTATVTVNATVGVTFGGTPTLCAGGTTVITASPPGGTFTITAGATIVSSSLTSCTVTGSTAGTATITYTGAAVGCGGTATETITVYAVPSVTVDPAIQVICERAEMTANVTGGSGAYSYLWSPAAGLIENTTATVYASGLGADVTYVVVVTDNATGCTGTGSSIVIVPCKQLCGAGCNKTVNPLGYSGTLAGGTIGAGTYYLDNNLTITANTTFLNAVVAIKPGVQITVANGVQLNIVGSHFYCCSDDQMWLGFMMLNGAGTSASMDIGNNSLIEDATIAVAYPNPPIASPLLFNSNGTVFNRNQYGLYIQNYLNPAAAYPITITNTVFTSRDFTLYQNPTTLRNYPCAWPAPQADLKAPNTPSAQVYLPMNIDNPMGMTQAGGATGPYPKIGCKTTALAGLDAYTGIYIRNVGPTAAAAFTGLVVNGGSTTPYSNSILFDNMNYGIYALNSNLTVTGCFFAHMHPHVYSGTATYNGDGIYANKSLTGNKHGLYVNTATSSAPGFDNNTNYFYSCTNGVECNNYNLLSGNFNKMYSDHVGGKKDIYNGNYGYKIVNNLSPTSSAYSVTVDHNYIANITNGIDFTCNDESLIGNIDLSWNAINGVLPDYLLGYTTMGISASKSGSSAITTNTGFVYITANSIDLTYNGINANGFERKIAIIRDNKVDIIPDAYITPGSQQFGIHYIKLASPIIVGRPLVSNNFVKGDLATYSSLNYMNGFCGEFNNNVIVSCNNSINTYRGFYFIGAPNIHAYWTDNNMANNTYGMYLNNSIINTQGTFTGPVDDTWSGSWPSGTFQTYVIGFSSASSKLYIRTGTGSLGYYNPSPNTGALPGLAYSYPTRLLNTSPAGSATYCAPIDAFLRVTSSGDSSLSPANSSVGVFVESLTQYIDSTGRISARIDSGALTQSAWITQMGIYQALMQDSTLVDSSATLWAFANMATTSRYALLTHIENSMVTGDFATAISLMAILPSTSNTTTDTASGVVMADGAWADGIVANYTSYYNLYMKYATDTLNATDSATLKYLAGMCPIVDGTIIYEAKALYGQVFNEVPPYNSDCGSDSVGSRNGQFKGGNNGVDDALQSYQLYPNPNDGHVTLMQYLLDTEPLNIAVLNSKGESVVQLNEKFTGYIKSFELGKLKPGLYLFHITNTYGKSFNLKFTIQ